MPEPITEIVLLAVNARWTHTAFGALSLLANLGDLRSRAKLVEKTINDRPIEIVEAVLALRPLVVGIGVYVWNVPAVSEVVAMLKALRPDLQVVLGGPEVICVSDLPAVAEQADYVVSGEAEVAFRELCLVLLKGDRPTQTQGATDPPDLENLELSYELYSDEDLAHRKLYLEASRGCPFGCTFCLSSLDDRVRKWPIDRLLQSLDGLWRRGARHFRFVDRAMHCSIGPEILEFFLDRFEAGVFLHFELVPDRLSTRLRDILPRFPDGSVQLEAGVQTFNTEVARRIGRHQDSHEVERNLRWLRTETGVHIHADLVVGLPGEDLAGFAAGFDRLLALRPHEIQVGLLKRLRGTKLARESDHLGLVFDPTPPYEILETREVSFSTVQRLRRFARYFDLVHNNGHLPASVAMLFDGASAFNRFLGFSDWLYDQTGQSHGFSLNRLTRFVARYLHWELGVAREHVESTIAGDYERRGRVPINLWSGGAPQTGEPFRGGLPDRQSRHQKG